MLKVILWFRFPPLVTRPGLLGPDNMLVVNAGACYTTYCITIIFSIITSLNDGIYVQRWRKFAKDKWTVYLKKAKMDNMMPDTPPSTVIAVIRDH